jgi:hypothetical protein
MIENEDINGATSAAPEYFSGKVTNPSLNTGLFADPLRRLCATTEDIYIVDITPDDYRRWSIFSKDLNYFRSALKVLNSKNLSLDQVVTEFALHGMHVDQIRVYGTKNPFEFVGVVFIPISGPNSVLDYLWHKHKFAPDQAEHREVVELKKSWLTM